MSAQAEIPQEHECSDYFVMETATFQCCNGTTGYRNMLRCTVCNNMFIEESDEDPCPDAELVDGDCWDWENLPDGKHWLGGDA